MTPSQPKKKVFALTLPSRFWVLAIGDPLSKRLHIPSRNPRGEPYYAVPIGPKPWSGRAQAQWV